MRKILIIAILICTFTQNAFSFYVNAQVRYNRLQAQAFVVNNFNRPIICDMSVQGFPFYGQGLFSFLDNVVIYPGQIGRVYVYTNARNPFVNASGNANCIWY